MTTFLLFSLALALCAVVALWMCNCIARDSEASARADELRLHQWCAHNVRAIHAHLAYAYPEVTALCNALEMALPARSEVDLDALERRLLALRRAHNAWILRRPASDHTLSVDLAHVVATERGITEDQIHVIPAQDVIVIRIGKGGAA